MPEIINASNEYKAIWHLHDNAGIIALAVRTKEPLTAYQWDSLGQITRAVERVLKVLDYREQEPDGLLE